MMDPTDVLADSSAVAEAKQAELGDDRRTQRFAQIVKCLKRRPDRSVPEALEEEADQEGYYRFIRNPSVEPKALLEPHFEATATRAEQLEQVLCIHDTTEFAFPVHDDHIREHVTRLSANRQGFRWHTGIVTSAEGTQAPLGMVSSQPFVHFDDVEDTDTRAFWDKRGGLFDNEKWRWLDGVKQAEARLENVEDIIHVMDREADDFQTLFRMDASDCDFVVRLAHNRNISTGEGRTDHEKLREALGRKRWRGHRRVNVSARSASEASGPHSARGARCAKLRARAATVQLRRPDSVEADSAPETIDVGVVQVREVNAPKGEEPIEWLLVTNRSIEKSQNIWQIVDWYQSRWLTEEFYKSIKTGCDYTSLQHRSAKTLLCALSATAIVAHHLLVLRHLGRHAEAIRAEAVVDKIQLEVLKATKPKPLSESPTAGEVMMAVAKLGGHIQSNGQPGWKVLGRGWQRLLEYEHAFKLGMAAQKM